MKTLESPNTVAAGTGSSGCLNVERASALAGRVERVIAYMMANLDQPLQVASLAMQANVSPSHFFAVFKRQTGSAPIDYFIRLRMERARQLLETTPASVKEVAAVLGYSDPFYFSRLFKAVYRVAPSECRQRRREAQGLCCSRCGNGDIRRARSAPPAEARVGRGLAGASANAVPLRQFA